jgi:hypothetical protein
MMPTMRVGGLPDSAIPLWEAWAYIPDGPCQQQPQLTTTLLGLHLSNRSTDVKQIFDLLRIDAVAQRRTPV